MVANLYTDLLINDRLQRQGGLRMADIYRKLGHAAGAGTWQLYMRIYEYLWDLDKGSLCGPGLRNEKDTDAWLGARLVRVYADDWMTGGSRFASLLLPYLLRDKKRRKVPAALQDTSSAAAGCEPGGLDVMDADEEDSAVHPLDDPRIVDLDDVPGAQTAATQTKQGHGQARRVALACRLR